MKAKPFVAIVAFAICLASFHLAAGPDEDSFAATKLKAEKGDAPAQYTLGLMYDNGQGITKDETEAYKWFLLGAPRALRPQEKGFCLLKLF